MATVKYTGGKRGLWQSDKDKARWQGRRSSGGSTTAQRVETKIQVLPTGVRYGNTTYTGNTVVPGSGGLTANQLRQQSLVAAKAQNPNIKAGSYSMTYTQAEAQELAKQYQISERNREIAEQQREAQEAQRQKLIQQASGGRVVKPTETPQAKAKGITQTVDPRKKILTPAPYKTPAPGAPTGLTPSQQDKILDLKERMEANRQRRINERSASEARAGTGCLGRDYASCRPGQRIDRKGEGSFTMAMDIGGGLMQDIRIGYRNGIITSVGEARRETAKPISDTFRKIVEQEGVTGSVIFEEQPPTDSFWRGPTSRDIREAMTEESLRQKEESKVFFTPEQSDIYREALRTPDARNREMIEQQIAVIDKYKAEIEAELGRPITKKLQQALEDIPAEMKKLENKKNVTQADVDRYNKLKGQLEKVYDQYKGIYDDYQRNVGIIEETAGKITAVSTAGRDRTAREEFEYQKELERLKDTTPSSTLVKNENLVLDFGSVKYSPDTKKIMERQFKETAGAVWGGATKYGGAAWTGFKETAGKQIMQEPKVQATLLALEQFAKVGDPTRKGYDKWIEKNPQFKEAPIIKIIEAKKKVDAADPNKEVVITFLGRKRRVRAGDLQGKSLYDFNKELFLGEVEESFTGVGRTFRSSDAQATGKSFRLFTEFAPYALPGVFATEYGIEASEAVIGGPFGGPKGGVEFVKEKPVETAIIIGGGIFKGIKYLKKTIKNPIPKQYKQYIGDPDPTKTLGKETKDVFAEAIKKTDEIKVTKLKGKLQITGGENLPLQAKKTLAKYGDNYTLLYRRPGGDYLGVVKETRKIIGKTGRSSYKTFTGTIEYNAKTGKWTEVVEIARGVKRVTTFNQQGEGIVKILKNNKLLGFERFQGVTPPKIELAKEIISPKRQVKQLGRGQKVTDVLLERSTDLKRQGLSAGKGERYILTDPQASKGTGLIGKKAKVILEEGISKQDKFLFRSLTEQTTDDIIFGGKSVTSSRVTAKGSQYGVQANLGKQQLTMGTKDIAYGSAKEVSKQSDDLALALRGKSYKIDLTSKGVPIDRTISVDVGQSLSFRIGDDVIGKGAEGLRAAKELARRQRELQKLSFSEFSNLGLDPTRPAKIQKLGSWIDDTAKVKSEGSKIVSGQRTLLKTLEAPAKVKEQALSSLKGGGKYLVLKPEDLGISQSFKSPEWFLTPKIKPDARGYGELTRSLTSTGLATRSLIDTKKDVLIDTKVDTTVSSLSLPEIDFNTLSLTRTDTDVDTEQQKDKAKTGSGGTGTTTITDTVIPEPDIPVPDYRPPRPRPPERPPTGEKWWLGYPDVPDNKKTKTYETYYPEYIPEGEQRFKRLDNKPHTFTAALSEAAKKVDKFRETVGRVVQGKPIVQDRRKKSPLIDTKDNYYKKNKQKFRTYSFDQRGNKIPLPNNTFVEKKAYREDSPFEKMQKVLNPKRKKPKRGKWKSPLKF